MGFSNSVKREMLVAAARHCCVCHRYKGVKVEVHHIVQEADGGENTFENAIALCFDCHADAGHYNRRHPRGTKFSPQELRSARNAWLEIVKTNQIESDASEPNDLLCRYYICKNFEVLCEVARLDLSNFPAEAPLLCRNEAFKSLANLVRRHPGTSRSASRWGKEYQSEAAFLEQYPASDQSPTESAHFPYYIRTRVPTQDELLVLAKEDGVVSAMLEAGMAASEEVAVVGYYEDACAGVEFQEQYLLRDVWGAFLTIKNTTNNPILLKESVGLMVQQPGFVQFGQNGIAGTLNLPKASIDPGATVIVPIAALLPPVHPVSQDRFAVERFRDSGEFYLSIAHCTMEPAQTADFLVYGTSFLPEQLQYERDGQLMSQKLHSFDLTNFYDLSKEWACGSCPHAFWQRSVSVAPEYFRELLATSERKRGTDEFVVPPGVQKLLIAEIEDEVTYIAGIWVNSVLIAGESVLSNGEQLVIDVSPGDSVVVSGKYEPLLSADDSSSGARERNELVHEFIQSCAGAQQVTMVQSQSFRPNLGSSAGLISSWR